MAGLDIVPGASMARGIFKGGRKLGALVRVGKSAVREAPRVVGKSAVSRVLSFTARAFRGRNANPKEISKYVSLMERYTDPAGRPVKVIFIKQETGPAKTIGERILRERNAGAGPTMRVQGTTTFDEATKTWYVVFEDRTKVKAAALYEEYLHIVQIGNRVGNVSAQVTLRSGRVLTLKPGQAQELDAAVKMLRESRRRSTRKTTNMVAPGDIDDKVRTLASHYLKEHRLSRDTVRKLLEDLAASGWTLRP
jgi:hypothetical protein